MVDPEQKRKTIERWVKYGVIVVGAGLSYEFAMMALEGLIAWGAVAISVLTIVNFAPAIGVWFANKRIQALIAVIEANPIETMQNLLIEKHQEYQRQEDAVTEFDTQFRNVSDLVDGLKNSDPEEAVSYAEMRDKMADGLTELRAEQKAAAQELKTAESALAKMQRIWKVACAMNKALTASQSAQAQVFAQMKQDVAVDTVRTNLNRAFAKLNTAVEHRKNANVFSSKVEAVAVSQALTQPALPPAVEVVDITPTRLFGSRSGIPIGKKQG